MKTLILPESNVFAATVRKLTPSAAALATADDFREYFRSWSEIVPVRRRFVALVPYLKW